MKKGLQKSVNEKRKFVRNEAGTFCWACGLRRTRVAAVVDSEPFRSVTVALVVDNVGKEQAVISARPNGLNGSSIGVHSFELGFLHARKAAARLRAAIHVFHLRITTLHLYSLHDAVCKVYL